MHDEQERAAASTRRLPPSALAGLREAFAAELADRLPRLRRAVDTGDSVLLQESLRDVHSLGSSAAVVGEADVSRSARAAEALLAGWPADEPVPSGLVARVDELTSRLADWRP